MTAARSRAHRPGSLRKAIHLLAAGALLAVGVAAPVAARSQPASPSAQWSRVDRPVSQRSLGSARAAAAAAHANPRSAAQAVGRTRPTARANHPASPGREPFAGATAMLTRRETSKDANGAAASSTTPKTSTTSGGEAATGSAALLLAPDAEATTTFNGLAQAESGNWVPPDPWVAASSSYVVQSVNSMVRITNRSGAELLTIPTWSLFALTADQNPTDARILWDAVHGRWVAIAASFNALDTNDFLNLAISDTSDPTGSWNIIAYGFGDSFPDYPSIASSNDKIVLTSDVFHDFGLGLEFWFSDISTFTWASLLGGVPSVSDCVNGSFFHARAAQVLSSATDVHVILASTADNEQFYFRLTGTGLCELDQFADFTDLVFFSPFVDPPDPRQDGDTLAAAIDGRPTDAIWKNGQLWWVSTYPITYDAGATYNDGVVLWNVTATTGAPVEGTPQVISAGNGVDDFMGGIGLTRDDNLVAVYSESGPASTISMRALRIPSGGSVDTSQEIATSAANSASERWGDYAGVAMDPVGTGAVWATHEVIAADGTWRTVVTRLVIDGDVPTTPSSVGGVLVVPTTLGASSAVRLSWPAATDGASGAVTYQIRQQIDGGGYGSTSNVAGTSTVRSLPRNHTTQFEVRAVDAVGTVGAWRVSPVFRPYLYESTSSTTVTGTWGTSSSSSFSGGTARYATSSGASATFTASSARGIAIVTTKAKTRGSFKVYVDGVYKTTISTYATTTSYRRLVYQFSWSSPGTHKVKIVVSGTSGHPRVDVDAFVVLR